MITSQHSNAQTANSSSSTFSKCNGLRVIYPVVKTFSWRFTADIYQRHQISSHVIIVSSPDTKKDQDTFIRPEEIVFGIYALIHSYPVVMRHIL